MTAPAPGGGRAPSVSSHGVLASTTRPPVFVSTYAHAGHILARFSTLDRCCMGRGTSPIAARTAAASASMSGTSAGGGIEQACPPQGSGVGPDRAATHPQQPSDVASAAVEPVEPDELLKSVHVGPARAHAPSRTGKSGGGWGRSAPRFRTDRCRHG